MSKATWESWPGEPELWHGRFQRFYLLGGSERSLEDAYRRFREEVQAGVGQVHRPPPRRMPGSWQEAARKWEWARRARAYDAEEYRRLQRALFESRKKAAQKHDALMAAQLNGAIRQATAVDWSKITSPKDYVPLMVQLIRADREMKGAPIHVEVTHRGEGRDDEAGYDAAAEAAAADAERRFSAGPEVYAAVATILASHETKVYEDQSEGDADPPPAPADAAPHETPEEAVPPPAV